MIPTRKQVNERTVFRGAPTGRAGGCQRSLPGAALECK